MKKNRNKDLSQSSGPETEKSEQGFSMIEVVIALVIIMIALLGVFATLTYAVTYNAGNKSRSQTLAVMQQEVERYRAAKFNSTTTDSNPSPASPGACLVSGLRDLRGRAESTCLVTAVDNRQFEVRSKVDNDPAVTGIQVEGYQCLSPQNTPIPCAIKEITIEVRLAAPSPGWQTAIPMKTVLRRTMGN